tara:strand:- start:123 stop:407 length:285 start_codon:yes stop_codon:yes gene_type:complete
MIMGQWQPHTNPRETDRPEFASVTDIVIDIADRALGGFCDFNDDVTTYPQIIVEYYQSPDCPEPLNKEVYQRVLFEEPSRVRRAIHRAICRRIY